MKRFSEYNVPPEAAMDRLNAAADELVAAQFRQLGYPFNHAVNLGSYYRWLADSGLAEVTLINVGDPWKTEWDMLDTDAFERDCVGFMARHYHFAEDNFWGIITNGGTDGNMHGVYFGRKALAAQSALPPILYVSAEAHYSVQKLGDVQNIETRVIKALPAGQMDVADFDAQLDPSRPALVVLAVGGTFKGAIDDQIAVNAVLQRRKPVAVHRHLDVALFGGYLPFLHDPKAREIVDQQRMHFDSLAVSGHKFLAVNEPCGLFICTKAVRDAVQSTPIPYLMGAQIPTISCSRSGFNPLRMYWRIITSGESGFARQAEHVLKMTAYMQAKLSERGIFSLVNPYSNTVCFARPKDGVIHQFALSCSDDPHFGPLSHLVVMQYFSTELIDAFIEMLE